jgi:hypothetical protein
MDQFKVNARVEAGLTSTIVSRGILTDSGHFTQAQISNQTAYYGTSRIASVNGLDANITVTGTGAIAVSTLGNTITIDSSLDSEPKLRSINQLQGAVTVQGQGDITVVTNANARTITISATDTAIAANSITRLGNLFIANSTIGVIDTTSPLVLRANGSGAVHLNTVQVRDSTITVPNQDFSISAGSPAILFPEVSRIQVTAADGYVGQGPVEQGLMITANIPRATTANLATTAARADSADLASMANLAIRASNWGNIAADESRLSIPQRSIRIAANTRLEFSNVANVSIQGLPQDSTQRIIYTAADRSLQLATVQEYSTLLGTLGSATQLGNYTSAARVPVGAMCLAVAREQQTINDRLSQTRERTDLVLGAEVVTGTQTSTEAVVLNQLTARTTNMNSTRVVKLQALRLNSTNYWVIFDENRVLVSTTKERLDQARVIYTAPQGQAITTGLVLSDGRVALVSRTSNFIYRLTLGAESLTEATINWSNYQLPYYTAVDSNGTSVLATFNVEAMTATAQNNIVIAGFYTGPLVPSTSTTTRLSNNYETAAYNSTNNKVFVATTRSRTSYPTTSTTTTTEYATYKTVTRVTYSYTTNYVGLDYTSNTYSWYKTTQVDYYRRISITSNVTTYALTRQQGAIFEFNPSADHSVTTVNNITGTHGLSMAFTSASVPGYVDILRFNNQLIAIPPRQGVVTQNINIAVRDASWSSVAAGTVRDESANWQNRFISVVGDNELLMATTTTRYTGASPLTNIIKTSQAMRAGVLGEFSDSAVTAPADIQAIAYNNSTDNKFYIAITPAAVLLSSQGTLWTSVSTTSREYRHIAVLDSELLILDSTGAQSMTGLITALDVPPTILRTTSILLSTTTNPSHPAPAGTYRCVGGPIDGRIFLWMRVN